MYTVRSVSRKRPYACITSSYPPKVLGNIKHNPIVDVLHHLSPVQYYSSSSSSLLSSLILSQNSAPSRTTIVRPSLSSSLSAFTTVASPVAATNPLSSSSSSSLPRLPPLLCNGCGAHLQTRDVHAAGYIPTHKKLIELQQRSQQALQFLKNNGTGTTGNTTTTTFMTTTSASNDTSSSSLYHTLANHGTICQRCFQMKHYGKLLPLAIPENIYVSYLDTLANLPYDKSSLILLVVDIWDFHGPALITTLRTLFRKNWLTLLHPSFVSSDSSTNHNTTSSPKRPSLLIAVNKVDLLPKDVSLDRLDTWIRTELRKMVRIAIKEEIRTNPSFASFSLPIPNNTTTTTPSSTVTTVPYFDTIGWRGKKAGRDIFGDRDTGGIVGLHLVSAIQGWSMGKLLIDIKEHYRGRDVYVVGAPNVGKSSVINSLLARQWDLPWTSSGKIKKDPTKTVTRTLFLDEIPEGYQIGDVYTGDIHALADTVRSKTEKQALIASSGDEDTTNMSVNRTKLLMDDPGLPLSSHPNPNNSQQVSQWLNESTTVLNELKARKAKHKETKEESSDGKDSSVIPPSVTIAVSSSPSPRPVNERIPTIPFTTSPLPGTTLGVIGAPLDAHGHAYLYDTPGIVGDPSKQRMLEGIAWEVDQVRNYFIELDQQLTNAATKQKNSWTAKTKKSSLATLSSSWKPKALMKRLGSSASILELLVPNKRPTLLTYRLRPGRSLFLAGLTRIDWIHPDEACHILITVATAPGLGIHTTNAIKAEALFHHALEADEYSHTYFHEKFRPGSMNDGSIPETKDTTRLNDTVPSVTAKTQTLIPKDGGAAILWPRWGPLNHSSVIALYDVCNVDQQTIIRKVMDHDQQYQTFVQEWEQQQQQQQEESKSNSSAVRLSTIASSSYRPRTTVPSYMEDIDEEITTIGPSSLSPSSSTSTSATPEDTITSSSISSLQNISTKPMKLPSRALAPGASVSSTLTRRRERHRKALVDIVLSGLGWLSITPIEIEGQIGWSRTIGYGQLKVQSADGVKIHTRSPLLPFEASGTRPTDWKE